MATTTERTWQQAILDELDQATLSMDLPEDHTHAAIWVPADLENEDAELLGTAAGEIAAVVIAEDLGATRTAGEARVVKLDDLYAWSQNNDAPIDGPTVEPRRQNVETEEGDEVKVDDEDAETSEDAPAKPPTPAELAAAAETMIELDAGGQTKAFNASDYDREDLQIPKIDGQSIDRISIKWSGEVFLDRSDPDDVAVYNALRLGKDVQLLVEAKCSSTGAKGATDREGDLDVIVATKGLKVHSLMRPAGADWVS